MKVLFLYTELADYFIRCCEVLARQDEVHIVRWPVNPEAPFAFSIPSHIKVYEKNHYDRASLIRLAEVIDPDVIVCSGWMDKDYLKVARSFRKKAPRVMISDTWWTGSLRQRIMLLPGRLTLKATFSHMWVPGKRQEKFARLLGFKGKAIPGYYCCDLARFNRVYDETRAIKRNVPKRFIYTGRYYEFKGVTDLWNAFARFREESGSDWELWCVGTGSVTPRDSPGIRHFGFVQPGDLAGILSGAGVFILPSRAEPWGVVVQEFAAAGFPLLLSDRVGAAEAFLDDGVNGYSFKAGDEAQLCDVMRKIAQLPPKALNLMAEKSHLRAQQITPEGWSDGLRNAYKEWYDTKDPDHRRRG